MRLFTRLIAPVGLVLTLVLFIGCEMPGQQPQPGYPAPPSGPSTYSPPPASQPGLPPGSPSLPPTPTAPGPAPAPGPGAPTGPPAGPPPGQPPGAPPPSQAACYNPAIGQAQTAAMQATESGNHQAAVQYLSQAIQLTPPYCSKYWYLLFNRGLAYKRLGNIGAARADMQAAAQAKPSMAPTISNLLKTWPAAPAVPAAPQAPPAGYGPPPSGQAPTAPPAPTQPQTGPGAPPPAGYSPPPSGQAPTTPPAPAPQPGATPSPGTPPPPPPGSIPPQQ